MLQYSINSHGREGKIFIRHFSFMLYINVISHGSEGRQNMLQISLFPHDSEGRPEEMICLKKVRSKNEIWFNINFVCSTDYFMYILLFTNYCFKTVCNQRKEALKQRDILMFKKGTQLSSFFVSNAIKRGVPVLLHHRK